MNAPRCVAHSKHTQDESLIYTSHGFLKHQKGQRYSPKLLPTFCDEKDFKVKVLGEFDGFDSNRNPQVMQALCVTLDNGTQVPAYRYKAIGTKYNICQNYQFMVIAA